MGFGCGGCTMIDFMIFMDPFIEMKIKVSAEQVFLLENKYPSDPMQI